MYIYIYMYLCIYNNFLTKLLSVYTYAPLLLQPLEVPARRTRDRRLPRCCHAPGRATLPRREGASQGLKGCTCCPIIGLLCAHCDTIAVPSILAAMPALLVAQPLLLIAPLSTLPKAGLLSVFFFPLLPLPA